MAFTIVNVLLASALLYFTYGYSIEVPDSCKDKTYCAEKPDGYPQQLFDDYILERKLVQSKRYEGEPREMIHDRDSDNCHTKVTILQPYVVKSNTTMKYVLQSRFFQQLVKQTECLTNEAPCFHSIQKPSLKMTCTPTYGAIKLYLYDPIQESLEHVPVSFPVCCSCSIKSRI